MWKRETGRGDGHWSVRGRLCGASITIIAATALVWALTTAVLADGQAGEQGKPGKPDKAEKAEKPDFKPFDEVTKGYDLIEGFYPLYYNKKTDDLLAVIPKAMLGQNFLMARSIVAGGRFTSQQFGHRVMQWRQIDKRLVLVEPELRYLEGGDAPVADVIKRTYTDAIVVATAIVTKRGEDVVIDLDDVFKKDFAGVGPLFEGNVDPSISRWAKYKGFKDNVELEVDQAVMRGSQGGSRVTVHYSISRLAPTDYKPREADERLGHFLTVRKDWTVDHDSKTIFKRYINRWHLRKSEPSEKVCDVHPDDQIVFYIEKTVPVPYRRHIRDGILEWNKCFEKAGLRNVMQVRQQTEHNEFADYDPEDVNYNFFRWIVSGQAFARGPSRANPITGQILDADVVMDDSMVRAWSGQYDVLTAQGPTADHDQPLEAFLGAHPEWRFQTREQRGGAGLPAGPSAHQPMEPDPWGVLLSSAEEQGVGGGCSYACGVVHEIALADAFLGATGAGARREEYIGQWLRLITTHEVGHTLGLRHNFKASAWRSLEDILACEDENTPTSASVMDYLPAVYSPDRSERKMFLDQTVGPYDDLVIEYAYRVAAKDEDEKKMLKSIADRMAEQGLDYATDEDTSFTAPDPLVNRWDHASDPVAWAKYRMDLVKALQKDITEWAVGDGESYQRLRRAFDMLLFEYSRATQSAARIVGGQYLHRDRKGDPQERPPVEIVPVDKQRAGVRFLADYVLSERGFRFEPALLNKLAPGRWEHWDSDAFDETQDYPVHDRIAAVQHWALFHLLNPLTLGRVYDAELKVPSDQDALTTWELLDSVGSAVWAELERPDGSAKYSVRQPFISSIRRSLQRRHLDLMIALVLEPRGTATADAAAVARSVLTDLGRRMGEAQKNVPDMDQFSRAHLSDAQARITKALEAKYRL